MWNCYHCDNEMEVSLNQERQCEEHAREKLQDLREKAEKQRAEFEEAKKRYEQMKEKYNVGSYGEIEHQFNVEDRSDISKEDIQKVSDSESQFAALREELNGVEIKIDKLESSL